MLINLVVVLLMFVAVGAVIAIWTRDLLSAVIAVGVVGFTRTVTFVLLRAPDVAITQVVVEVLLLIILIRSTVQREVHTTEAWRSLPGTALVTAVLAVFLVFGILGVRQLDLFGVPVMSPDRKPPIENPPSKAYLENALKQTGSRNVVTAILADYRSFDLLAAGAVLFTAVIGAVALLRREGRKEPRETPGR